MIILTAAESRELDHLSQSRYGIPSYTLMTRAGEAVARAVARRWPEAMAAGVLIVAGKGNNGGDGFVAARQLLASGAPVRVLLLARPDELKGDAARACQEYSAAGGKMSQALDDAALHDRPGVVIDALFGTGLNAEVRDNHRRVITALNQLSVPVAAIDIASGVNADTGAVMGAAVRATVTVTFGFAKYGHVSYPGMECTGELEIADIGLAHEALIEIAPKGRLTEAGEAAQLIVPRKTNSHKGTYGHVMVIAGSRGKGGAAILAARGALYCGAGLVTAAIPDCVAAIVAMGQPELMTEPIADRDGGFAAAAMIAELPRLIAGKGALVVGPGIGVSADSCDLIAWLIRRGAQPDRALLIDADGLNALAQLGAAHLKSAAGPVVLTPHPGEMARLLNSSAAVVNADRIGAARELSAATGANVLLKGARSVIVTAGGVVHVNGSGNSGMATPGMGDVLSGIVGALLGQGMAAAEALRLGVFVHGYAADRLTRRVGAFGYLAGDLAAELPAAFTDLMHARPIAGSARGQP